jgi:hypothetical protein
MMLVIATQDLENYGAHAWDGVGACPQYWKAKGGSEIKITGIPNGVDPEEVLAMVRDDIEMNTEYFQTTIIGWSVEADGWISSFELSQLEYEGEIRFPEPEIEYSDLEARYTDPQQFAEQSADADAEYYGQIG